MTHVQHTPTLPSQMNLPQIQHIMMEFEKQNEVMGMKDDMMQDAMDDAFADDEDEDEEEAVLGSVFAELGVDLLNKMGETPTSAMAAPSGVESSADGGMVAAASDSSGGGGGGGDDGLDAELQRRLDNLRRT